MAARGGEEKMNFTNRTIFIISADPKVAQECADELAVFGGRYRTSFVNTIEQARTGFLRTPPTVVFSMNPLLALRAAVNRWNPPFPCLRRPLRLWWQRRRKSSPNWFF